MDFFKDIITYNLCLRLNDCIIHNIPPNRDYYISPDHFAALKNCIEDASDLTDIISNIDSSRLFSKGTQNLLILDAMLKNHHKPINISRYGKEIKYVYVAYFIINSQVFSDANHRTARYVLRNYGNFNVKDTERIVLHASEQLGISRLCLNEYHMMESFPFKTNLIQHAR